MAGFLRRFRRDKEKPGDTPAGAEPSVEGPGEAATPTPGSPPPIAAGSDAGAPTPGPSPPVPELTPTGPPPPLPQPDVEGSRPERLARATSLTCFICGTAMQGSYCPTCRMNWVE